MTIFVKNKHTLQIDEFKFKCSIGKNGTTKHKKERDKKLQEDYLKSKIFIFERSQRKPLTLLRCIEIKKYGLV